MKMVNIDATSETLISLVEELELDGEVLYCARQVAAGAPEFETFKNDLVVAGKWPFSGIDRDDPSADKHRLGAPDLNRATLTVSPD